MADLDGLLQAQDADARRDREIERILACAAGDSFAVLEINALAPLDSLAAAVRKAYRQKSLLIHPDKTSHEHAPRAFDVLRRAQQTLGAEQDAASDDAAAGAAWRQKQDLVDVYQQVARGLGAARENDYSHESNVAVRAKVAQVLQDHERAREVEHQYSQRQEMARQSELKSAAQDRELRRSWESRWENDRDARVSSWRRYAAKVDKPRKKKKKVLV